MDLDIIRSREDCIHGERIADLRKLNTLLRAAFYSQPERIKKDTYLKEKLIKIYDKASCVMETVTSVPVNVISFHKLCSYYMLFYTIQDIFDNSSSSPHPNDILKSETLVSDLHGVFTDFFTFVFDYYPAITTNERNDYLLKCLRRFCKIASKVCYSRNRETWNYDKNSDTKKQSTHHYCIHCILLSNNVGIGRLEEICGKEEFRSFTSFKVEDSKGLCSLYTHIEPDSNAYGGTRYDMLISER